MILVKYMLYSLLESDHQLVFKFEMFFHKIITSPQFLG